MKRERDAEAELNLPAGFRFHPTDEELVVHYLCRKAAGYQPLSLPFIAEIDLYRHDPWHLPEKALFGTKEWYFFTPRDRKYPNGSRPNRAAGSGYWKATGADKPIRGSPSGKTVGIKKALVFYTGTKAAKGIKTNWIMHEYRLAHPNPPASKGAATSRLDDWVLCRLYNKKNNWEAEKVRLEEGKKIIEEDDADRGELDNRNNSRHGHECYSDGDSSIVEQGDDDHDLTPGIHSPVTSTSTSLQLMEQYLEVDDGDKGSSTDWFTNLNLDDLHQLLAAMPPVPADFTSPHTNFSHLHTRNF